MIAVHRLVHCDFVFHTLLPLLTLFFNLLYVPKFERKTSRQEKDIFAELPLQELSESMQELLEIAQSQQVHMSPQNVHDLLRAMHEKKIEVKNYDKLAVVRPMDSRALTEEKMAGDIVKPKDLLKIEHVKEFFTELNLMPDNHSSQLQALADVFNHLKYPDENGVFVEVGLTNVVAQCTPKGKQPLPAEEIYELVQNDKKVDRNLKLLKRLLNQLLGTKPPATAELTEADESSRKLTVTLLAVVHKLFEVPEGVKKSLHMLRHFDSEKIQSMQNDKARARRYILHALDVTTLAVRAAGCENEKLCYQGLQLLIALLKDDAHKQAQDKIYDMLSRGSSATPFDSPTSSFLERMKERLRVGVKEIKFRKSHFLQQQERARTFEETTKDMTPDMKAVSREDIDRPFESKAFVVETLVALKQLCEGHNQKMQGFLSAQENKSTSYNLVVEVYELLDALVPPETDKDNFDQLAAAVETLLEMVQGQRSKENAKFLLNTKLITKLDTLVNSKPVDGVEVENMQAMRNSAVYLLRALIEGNHDDAKRRMLFFLPNIDELEHIAADWLLSSNEKKNSKEIKALELKKEGAFSLYILCAELKEFQLRSPNGVERTKEDDEEPTPQIAEQLKNLKEMVRSVEIMNDQEPPQLERVYFRVPAVTKLLTEQTKTWILDQVDPMRPNRQVQDVISNSRYIKREIEHLEKLQGFPVWKLLTFLRDKGIIEFMFMLAIVQNLLLLIRYSSFGGDSGHDGRQLYEINDVLAQAGGFAAQAGGFAAQAGGFAAQAGGFVGGFAGNLTSGVTGLAGGVTDGISHFELEEKSIEGLETTLGVLQMICSFTVFCLYAVQYGILSVQQALVRELDMEYDDIRQKMRESMCFWLLHGVIKAPIYLLQASKTAAPRASIGCGDCCVSRVDDRGEGGASEGGGGEGSSGKGGRFEGSGDGGGGERGVGEGGGEGGGEDGSEAWAREAARVAARVAAARAVAARETAELQAG